MKKIILLSFLILLIFTFGFRFNNRSANNEFEKFLKKSGYTSIPLGIAYTDGKETAVDAFYISKGEVTNFQYQEFLSYLKVNNDLEKLAICKVDSANWSTKTWINKGMEEHYHKHPAYQNYPVVNISHEAAELYCAFVSESLSKRFGISIELRLPKYEEYIRAARGDNQTCKYAWNSSSTRNDKGQILGNFARIGEECVARNVETGKLEVNLAGINTSSDVSQMDVLAPSISYWPNTMGVYNLCGNAAEMLFQKGTAVGGSWYDTGFDTRIESKKSFLGPDKTVGFRVVFNYSSINLNSK